MDNIYEPYIFICDPVNGIIYEKRRLISSTDSGYSDKSSDTSPSITKFDSVSDISRVIYVIFKGISILTNGG